jgi:hypothetical protein
VSISTESEHIIAVGLPIHKLYPVSYAKKDDCVAISRVEGEEFTTMKATVDQVKDAISSDIFNYTINNLSTIDPCIDALSDAIDKNSLVICSLSNDLSNQISAINGKIRYLSDEISSNDIDISNLCSEISADDGEIRFLSGRIDTLKSVDDYLSSAIRTEISNRETGDKDLSARVDRIEERIPAKNTTKYKLNELVEYGHLKDNFSPSDHAHSQYVQNS